MQIVDPHTPPRDALTPALSHTHTDIDVDVWAPTFAFFGGGITAFSRELASSLAALPLRRLRLLGKIDRGARWQSLELLGAGAWPAPVRTAGFALTLLAAVLRRRPSLIVSTHVNFSPVARFIHWLLGVRYVVVAHGVEIAASLTGSRLKALRNAHGVWAVSGWTRRRLLDLGIAEERIQVVPNTVAPAPNVVPASTLTALRERYGLADTDQVILTVARLDAAEGYKGYDKVLRALPAVRAAIGNVRYLIVGKGSDAARIRSMAKELGLAEAVILCGFVADHELHAHYMLADVFAMPSVGEGFGIVFLEAMACGVPVLAGNQDGSVDALAGGELGCLVDPGDVEAVARGLIALLRKEGPVLWFNPDALRSACLHRFGREAFRERVGEAIAAVIVPGSAA